MRKATKAVAGGGAVLLLLAAGTLAPRLRHDPPPAPATAAPAVTTVEVRRGDLTDSRLVAGTLGFGPAVEVRGGGSGVVTRLPRIGAKVTRGAELFRVDDQPVVVLYGDTPIFRVIDKVGLAGNDVLQLRRNLARLGYGSRAVTSPDRVDAPLLAQLKRWQQRLGVPSPGVLRPGQVTVVGGPGRVSDLVAELGAPVAGVVLRMTGTSRVVSVPMGAADAHAVKLGTKVTVVLPDGGSVPARVSAISRSVLAEPGSTEPPKLTVTVRPDSAEAVASFDAASVQVRFTTTARRNVLTVPVGALVALSEGGYAVQRPEGGLLAVRTGAFAGGLVEISGTGVTAGMTVVTSG